jgi:phosphatidylglycerol:prolipoprotein diacylglycerol transferase
MDAWLLHILRQPTSKEPKVLEELLQCMGPRRVAICLPWFGGPLPIYWYGVLASLGIFLGALYAGKHVELEGEPPDTVWDALLWVLIPALIGARLWFVGQIVLNGTGRYFLDNPLQIINFRAGGMNIFGGLVVGLIAIVVYARRRRVEGWLLADAGVMGALIGQGIGRFGNFINQELYGPPTTLPWGVRIPAEQRIGPWTDLTAYPVETTRFHPTFFYEAFWLFLSFAVLYYLFRRYQPRAIHGAVTGAYLVMAGFGRFWIEFFRPDQPRIPSTDVSFSSVLSVLYVVGGVLLLLQRYNRITLPGFAPPPTIEEREEAYQSIAARREEIAGEWEEARKEGKSARGGPS